MDKLFKLILLDVLVGIIFFSAINTSVGKIFGLILAVLVVFTVILCYSAYKNYCNQ